MRDFSWRFGSAAAVVVVGFLALATACRGGSRRRGKKDLAKDSFMKHHPEKQTVCHIKIHVMNLSIRFVLLASSLKFPFGQK